MLQWSKEKRLVPVILCGCSRRQTVKMHSDTDGVVISLLTAFYSMASTKRGAGSRSAAGEPTAAMSRRCSAQRLQSAIWKVDNLIAAPIAGECEIKCVLIDSEKDRFFRLRSLQSWAIKREAQKLGQKRSLKLNNYLYHQSDMCNLVDRWPLARSR